MVRKRAARAESSASFVVSTDGGEGASPSVEAGREGLAVEALFPILGFLLTGIVPEDERMAPATGLENNVDLAQKEMGRRWFIAAARGMPT